MSTNAMDPYAGNILVSGLGPILDPAEALKSLMRLPARPPAMDGVPMHVRLHLVMDVLDIHIPTIVERKLQQSIDLIIRQNYKARDPRLASTWGSISGEVRHSSVGLHPALAAAVEGISGVGKTRACQGCFATLPRQVIWHESFPRLVGGLHQVVYQSIEVPASGRASDLARALMSSWTLTTGSQRFDQWLAKDKIHGHRALEEWRQVAVTHFLGALHLDEIQNLFKLSTLRQRKARRGGVDAPELAIVEDFVLRWMLSLTNSGQVALLLSGTPDGIGAVTKRLSTMQRVTTGGYHQFERLDLKSELAKSRSSFLQILAGYQYVQQKITMDDKLIGLIFELTAGVQRIVVALWIAAHRVAFDRKTDDLRREDFVQASRTWLAPLGPAIAALRSGDPEKMSRYDDLIPRDTAFWASFWERVGH